MESHFLQYCKDEELSTMIQKDIHIESIEMFDTDAVLILREPWLWGIQGYIVIRNGGELTSDMDIPYEDPECEKLGDGIYSFKWISMP